MHQPLSFEGIDKVNSLIEKNIKKNISYALGFSKESMHAGHLRSYATERNNDWKKQYKQFVNDNSPRTADGKLNNNFYRFKFKYDVVVPAPVLKEIIDYYLYSLENKVVEDIEFMEKYIDHMMMFCQAIFYYKDKYISYIQSKRDKTPMYVRLIYNFIGRDYRKVLYFLQKIGVIDIDHMYVPKYRDYKSDSDRKGICKHYGFELDLGDQSAVYQISNRVIINKAYVSDVRISDDVEYASAGSNTKRSKEMNKYFSDNFQMSDEFKASRHLDYNGFTYFYSRICDGPEAFNNFIIGRDAFGHRFYHPFLNMKKEMRNFILINGSRDNSVVDINNSHPYFFSLLFDKKFLNYAKDLMTDDEVLLFQSVIDNPLFKEKINLFKKITSSGKYYDFLEENITTTLQYNIKKINMIFFYGPFNKKNSLYKFFAKNFDFINLVRYRMIRMSGYKRLCQLLQRVEAKLMIDDVFAGLKNDNFSVIPFHDAIMCSKSDVNVVKTRMLNAFKKIGVEYLPKFDKTGTTKAINSVFDKMKFEGGQLFLNKCILYEELNMIIKGIGIKNRVFKDTMKPEAQVYIDTKFESLRHLIDDTVADRYYDLRIKLDEGNFEGIDYTKLFEDYKKSSMMKKKFYARDVIGYVKINPVEFFNHSTGTNYKTRVKETNYVY